MTAKKKNAGNKKEIRPLTHPEQRALAAVGKLLTKNGDREPSAEELAEAMGVSLASSYGYLKSLREKGKLKTVAVVVE